MTVGFGEEVSYSLTTDQVFYIQRQSKLVSDKTARSMPFWAANGAERPRDPTRMLPQKAPRNAEIDTARSYPSNYGILTIIGHGSSQNDRVVLGRRRGEPSQPSMRQFATQWHPRHSECLMASSKCALLAVCGRLNLLKRPKCMS